VSDETPPADETAESAPLPQKPPTSPEMRERMAKVRAARNNGGKGPPRPGAKVRYRTIAEATAAAAALDPARAGVGSTESTNKGAEPPRYEAEGEITRMSLEDRQVTQFDIPVHRRKPGWDYKWEPLTVWGQKVDRSVIRDAYKAGWRPEKAKDWPELMVGAFESFTDDTPVEEGGQMLMGRPIHLSHEAQIESYNKAKIQERDRMQSAATGQSVMGSEALAHVRGVEVRNASLDVQLSVGSSASPRG
jgi:hypothetical protein